MRQRKDPKRAGGQAKGQTIGHRALKTLSLVIESFGELFLQHCENCKNTEPRECASVWAYLTVALLASCVSLRSRPSIAALPFVVIILLIDTDCSSVHSNISAKDFKDNTLHKNYLSSNIVYSFLHNNNHSLVDTIHRRHWGPIPDSQALLCPIPWSLHMVEIFANIMKPNMMTTTCKIITNNIIVCY